jgi:hypothetical protein
MQLRKPVAVGSRDFLGQPESSFRSIDSIDVDKSAYHHLSQGETDLLKSSCPIFCRKIARESGHPRGVKAISSICQGGENEKCNKTSSPQASAAACHLAK